MSGLRQWQSEALRAWHANQRRGIIASATGTGKTRLAIEAVREALAAGGHVMVVVPTRTLQDQWLRTLRAAQLVRARIGTIGGIAPDPNPDYLVLVAVIDSARDGAKMLIRHWNQKAGPTLLIVDECHWAGSAFNRGVFDGEAKWTLGLSATPERGDDGLDEVLVPSLGPIVYRYPIRTAMDDGVLADIRILNLLVDMPRADVHEYEVIQRRTAEVKSKLETAHPELFENEDWTWAVQSASTTIPEAMKLVRLVALRRRMLASNASRMASFGRIVGQGLLEKRRTIIFNETIQQAEASAEHLRAENVRFSIDHSMISPRLRAGEIAAFRTGERDVLVAVRTADEGLDVPDADQAIILAGTSNPRQRVQRIGRIVRLGDVAPRAISILAAGTVEETVVANRDVALFGPHRVRNVRQPVGRVLDIQHMIQTGFRLEQGLL